MPEGHTIHRLARDLNRDFRGGSLATSSPQGRFEDGAYELDGQKMLRAEALGKHLFLNFEAAQLHIHLGLFGKFRRQAAPADPPGENKRLRLAGPEMVWDLSGPTVCSLINPEEFDAIAKRIGPDPLRKDADPARFISRAHNSPTPIGGLLLNQAAIAGVGNVYRAEFCFLLGINPLTPAKLLPDEAAERLWDLSVEHLTEGVRLNRIVTRDPKEVGVARGRIKKGDRLYVYKRAGQPCRNCQTSIRRDEIAKRKVWFCPSCQPA